MATKKGLGKGLSALIPEEQLDSALSLETKEGVTLVDINKLKANENQPRKHFNKEKIAELSSSIKEHGVIQPLIVRKEGAGYQIVAGERRYRACILAGLKHVPVIIKDFDENTTLEVALIENVQREDLNELEKAFSYEELKNTFNMTQEDIAKKLGKSRASIANTLRLLSLEDEIKKMLKDDEITAGHGRAILSVEGKENRVAFAKMIIEKSLSVRQAEALSKDFIVNPKKEKKQKPMKEIDPYVWDIENRLASVMGTKVKVNHKGNKGTIEINYYNETDLDRILSIFDLD